MSRTRPKWPGVPRTGTSSYPDTGDSELPGSAGYFYPVVGTGSGIQSTKLLAPRAAGCTVEPQASERCGRWNGTDSCGHHGASGAGLGDYLPRGPVECMGLMGLDACGKAHKEAQIQLPTGAVWRCLPGWARVGVTSGKQIATLTLAECLYTATGRPTQSKRKPQGEHGGWVTSSVTPPSPPQNSRSQPKKARECTQEQQLGMTQSGVFSSQLSILYAVDY